MTQKFEDFFNHDEQVVTDAARFLTKVQAKYESGDISASEFKELAEDALEIEEISDIADDLDRKAEISKAIDTLRVIASVIAI